MFMGNFVCVCVRERGMNYVAKESKKIKVTEELSVLSLT